MASAVMIVGTQAWSRRQYRRHDRPANRGRARRACARQPHRSMPRRKDPVAV